MSTRTGNEAMGHKSPAQTAGLPGRMTAGGLVVDTHCHIHESDYPLPIDEVLQRAADAGVTRMLVVGTSEQSSADAVKFAAQYEGVFATVGVHPHDTKDGYEKIKDLLANGKWLMENSKTRATDANSQIVAIGEIGLDYFYNHSPRETQIQALESQMQTALDNELPIVFHVREAFDDFWPVFDNFRSSNQHIRGVLHSYTDNQSNLDKAFERGLYVGVNGISTFTRDAEQQKMYANIPVERMLLETDAPFLAPVPHRGSTNEPAHIALIARHHAKLRAMDIDELASITTRNACELFGL